MCRFNLRVEDAKMAVFTIMYDKFRLRLGLSAEILTRVSKLFMKNIQVIDGANNCVYDIFAAKDEEFDMIFQPGQDIAFIEEVILGKERENLDEMLAMIWKRRIPKCDVHGIHGTLFYGLEGKKVYYPNRRDEDAVNPDGSKLRQ